MQEMQVRFLGQKEPLEEEMAPHSSILAGRVPWREEAGRLQSIGSQRVRSAWSDLAHRATTCQKWCSLEKRAGIHRWLGHRMGGHSRQREDSMSIEYTILRLPSGPGWQECELGDGEVEWVGGIGAIPSNFCLSSLCSRLTCIMLLDLNSLLLHPQSQP